MARLTPASLAWLAAVLLFTAGPVFAHPSPYSYIDVRVDAHALDVTIAAHVYDLGHDLGVDPADSLLTAKVLNEKAAAIASLFEQRLKLEVDGAALTAGNWSRPQVALEQQWVRMQTRYETVGTPGRVAVNVWMFPYDPAHQTFVNVYERDTIASQQILDYSRQRFEYFADTRRGFWAGGRSFAQSGVVRILSGKDSILFLAGLLLLGGSARRLALIVGAFAAAHSVALGLAGLNLVNPPARIVAPAVALSIVYIGVDNLMIRGGRDVRVWIALAFGAVHGFATAGFWDSLDRPARASWSLVFFGTGVEIGHLIVAAALISVLSVLRARSSGAARAFTVAGSVLVAAAGAIWFVQRLFFPGPPS